MSDNGSQLTLEDMEKLMYGDAYMPPPEKFIVDRWSESRPLWQRMLSPFVRCYRFNKQVVRTMDGKVHRAGPI